jgi:hypothetical protein
VDEVGLDFVDETAQGRGGARNGQGAEVLPNNGTQAQAARAPQSALFSGTGPGGRFGRAKGDRHIPFSSQGQVVGVAGEGGGEVDFVAAFQPVAHPVAGNRGAAVGHEEQFHGENHTM